MILEYFAMDKWVWVHLRGGRGHFFAKNTALRKKIYNTISFVYCALWNISLAFRIFWNIPHASRMFWNISLAFRIFWNILWGKGHFDSGRT